MTQQTQRRIAQHGREQRMRCELEMPSNRPTRQPRHGAARGFTHLVLNELTDPEDFVGARERGLTSFSHLDAASFGFEQRMPE